KLLAAPPEPDLDRGRISEEATEARPARCTPSKPDRGSVIKRPIARGALGFRIRTAPKTYSVEKDPLGPPTGAAAPTTTSSPPKRRATKKTKNRTSLPDHAN